MDDHAIVAELVGLTGGAAPRVRQFRSLVGSHQYHRLYALVREYVPGGSEVLDWGAGNGHFSYYLVRRGFRTTAFSLKPCEFKDWFSADSYRFVQGDPQDPVHLPFADRSFDAVVSVGVLEHVRETGGNELASLREIRRVLRPGGLFICYHLPNRYSLIDAVARCIPRKHRHRYRFTKAGISTLVEEAGLALLETHRYGFLPRNSWGRFPRWLRNSFAVARGWDALDSLLSSVIAPLCQNHLFAAHAPER